MPGRVNLPAMAPVDSETKSLVSDTVAATRFRDVGADPSKRVIACCRGGIATTSDAFVLTRIGYSDVGVQDNSMSEWATAPSLPIETG